MKYKQNYKWEKPDRKVGISKRKKIAINTNRSEDKKIENLFWTGLKKRKEKQWNKKMNLKKLLLFLLLGKELSNYFLYNFYISPLGNWKNVMANKQG